jgi:hypothetical protein
LELRVDDASDREDGAERAAVQVFVRPFAGAGVRLAIVGPLIRIMPVTLGVTGSARQATRQVRISLQRASYGPEPSRVGQSHFAAGFGKLFVSVVFG